MASVIKLRNAWYVQVRIDGVYRKFYGFRNKKTAAVFYEIYPRCRYRGVAETVQQPPRHP